MSPRKELNHFSLILLFRIKCGASIFTVFNHACKIGITLPALGKRLSCVERRMVKLRCMYRKKKSKLEEGNVGDEETYLQNVRKASN